MALVTRGNNMRLLNGGKVRAMIMRGKPRKPFTPLDLFANNEQGAWYDPSDMSTLFQDAAGTTPVTALEQPVGKILDKSGRGNHASQTTTTARPVLSARYSLITYSEQFDNAVWIEGGLKAFGAGSVANTTATTDPLNGNTADFIQENTNNSTHVIYRTITVISASHNFSIALKAAGRNWVKVISDSTGTKGAWFNLSTGAVGAVDASVTASIKSLDNSWYRCSITQTIAGVVYPGVYITTGDNTIAAYTGDGASGIYIWGADLRVANDGVNLPPYQRVAAATDYDSTGFPQRVVYDRVDDAHTVSAGGGSTTAFFFCASIHLNAVGVTQTVYSDTGTNTGYRIRINSSNQLEMAVGNGSAYTTVNTTDTFALGERAVITCWHDGTNIYAQKNRGTIASRAFATATAGTDGFTLGKDNGAASSFFGGGIYEYVHTKNTYKGDAERAKTQSYCASKALVTL